MRWKSYLFILSLSFIPTLEKPSAIESNTSSETFKKCGRLFHDRDTEFVAGGNVVDRASTYPWSAAIVRVDNETHHEIYCHGSLISRNIVLTAAHCYKIKGKISYCFIEKWQLFTNQEFTICSSGA